MFRFTNRELVLVTVIVAFAVGWSLDHTKAGLEMGRARERIGRAEQREAVQREERQWAELRATKLYEQRVKILRAAAERMSREEFKQVADIVP